MRSRNSKSDSAYCQSSPWAKITILLDYFEEKIWSSVSTISSAKGFQKHVKANYFHRLFTDLLSRSVDM